jgi:predicted secreted protein
MPGIAGNLIGLKTNGAFTSCEISSSINFDREMVGVAPIDDGGWKEFLYGMRGWRMQVNGNLLLEAVATDIKSMLTAGYFQDLPLLVMFSTSPSASQELVFSGTALFQAGDISAAVQGKAGWNATLQGTGKLTVKQQDYNLLIDAMPAEADYPIIVDSSVI